MIWANLLHLGYNMWEDHEVSEPPFIAARSAKPYLRWEASLWNDLTARMVDAGMNLLLIDLGEGIQYESHPELAVTGSWTPAQLRTELARLRALGLEPIPKLNFSTAHDTWLGEYSRMVSTPRYYEVARDLITEVCALFDTPRFFHLGMDEETFGHQKYFNYAVVRQHDLWWHDLHFLVDQVEAQGVRAWIWSDYVWAHPEAFLAKMPKSVVQSNWYYNAQFRDFADDEVSQNLARYVDAYRKLEEHGFDQIPTGSNWSCAENFEGTVKFCREVISPERLLGFLTTPWYPTLESRRMEHIAAIEQVKAARLGPAS